MIRYQTGVKVEDCLQEKLKFSDEQRIAVMEREGATVILETGGLDGHVIKVRMPGKRQIRLASTSWYPIQGTFEKWQLENGVGQ